MKLTQPPCERGITKFSRGQARDAAGDRAAGDRTSLVRSLRTATAGTAAAHRPSAAAPAPARDPLSSIVFLNAGALNGFACC